MVKLVFARHGESEWNKANLFTGWADVDLSEKGTQQAIDAGKLIKEAGIEFDQAYTSVLKRAIKTTNLALEASDNFGFQLKIMALERTSLRWFDW